MGLGPRSKLRILVTGKMLISAPILQIGSGHRSLRPSQMKENIPYAENTKLCIGSDSEV